MANPWPLAANSAGNTNTPSAAPSRPAVTLLKVPGPVQMREEWLASRGAAAYAAMLAHVRELATQQQRPVSSLIAGDDGD